MSRSRTRGVAKWTGLVVCVVLFATMAMGARYRFRGGFCVGGVGLAFGYGCHAIFWNPNIDPIDWGASRGRSRNIKWWPELDSGIDTVVYIPGWLTLPTFAIPTAWLWRRDLRRPPGHCRKCGYDLTGNVTGVCSECGTKASAP